MSAGTDRDEDRILAAEYALGLLDTGEARAFEARLTNEPELRAAYALWAEDLAAMASQTTAEVTPPAAVFARIEIALNGAAPTAARGFWRRLGLGAVLAAAAIAAIMMLAPFLTAPPGGPDMVAELVAEQGGLRVTAGFDAETRVLEIARTEGAPAPGRSFELWLIAGEAAPVSLGVLPETERGLITVPPALAAQFENGVLAISDEPEGGSPTGSATGPVLAVAPILVITSS